MSTGSSPILPGRGLSPPERGLLRGHQARHRARVAEAMVLLLAARLLVAGVPFRHWRGWFGMVAEPGMADRPVLSEAAALRARRVGRAVDQAARHLPVATRCLPRAMAAAWMLQRRRISAEMVFGVVDSARRGTLHDLHAWVVCGDQIIVGDGEPLHNPILALRTMVNK